MADARVYGYVNGKPAYSADEFKYMRRGFGAITDDAKLMEYAEKVTSGWQQSGHKRTFAGFYISDYCMSEPCASLTKVEFERLKELQKAEEKRLQEADEARQWKKVDTVYYADNSIEEVWEDKDGIRKTVMTTAPHGDACY